MHNMYIVELCILLRVKSQLASCVELRNVGIVELRITRLVHISIMHISYIKSSQAYIHTFYSYVIRIHEKL